VTFVKFCGMMREQDVETACALGVQAVGFVLWSGSPRGIDLDRLASLARLVPAGVLPVGVFVRPQAREIAAAVEAGIRVAQLHGVTAEEFAASAATLERWLASPLGAHESAAPPEVTVLLDAHDPERHGGTGRTIDWTAAARVASRRRILLAGGLTPANVARAVRQVRPFGVDVASGVEEVPGVKSPQAMAAFLTAVRDEDRKS
jgi:phosphoribosylanthranilate isomerase